MSITMKKLPVSDLEGAQLIWAVAVAEGLKPRWFDMNKPANTVRIDNVSYFPWGNWSQGGPIIEREQIVYRHWASGQYEACVMTGEIGVNRKRTAVQFGQTLLIAAMRAFVASRCGSYVEVPA